MLTPDEACKQMDAHAAALSGKTLAERLREADGMADRVLARLESAQQNAATDRSDFARGLMFGYRQAMKFLREEAAKSAAPEAPKVRCWRWDNRVNPAEWHEWRWGGNKMMYRSYLTYGQWRSSEGTPERLDEIVKNSHVEYREVSESELTGKPREVARG